jgi:hypothetical protein
VQLGGTGTPVFPLQRETKVVAVLLIIIFLELYLISFTKIINRQIRVLTYQSIVSTYIIIYKMPRIFSAFSWVPVETMVCAQGLRSFPYLFHFVLGLL